MALLFTDNSLEIVFRNYKEHMVYTFNIECANFKVERLSNEFEDQLLR